MKVIRNWNDLEPYGIICLTGEACAYGYRLLCDITYSGKALIASIFDLPETGTAAFKLNPPWNSKGIGSIMLPPQMLTPLAVFALMKDCKRVFISYTGEVYGVEETDAPADVEKFIEWNQGKFCETCNRYGAGGGIQFQYSNPGYARNMHQMTGRTV